MYENFYALREKPFSLAPDPAYRYPAKRYRHALTMLEYALSQSSGFAVITGEVGCGKTTVVRRRTVLVIDEAQNLGVTGLEELRVLSNLNVGKDLLSRCCMTGPEFCR
jgi:type II secretory pathway predicted ATPase ExeA